MALKRNTMRGQDNKIKRKEGESTFQRIEKMHPHKMLLYLGMVGSGLIFFFMIIAYTISQPQTALPVEYKMPKAFICSTILLLLSGFSTAKLLQEFERDNIKQLKNELGLTLLLGIAFAVSQYVGWLELQAVGVYFSGQASGSFLYVISGLHVFHLLVGLSFLTYLYFYALWVCKDPVRSLIMVTNPYQKIKLQIFTIYWQFLNVLWLTLFLYFLFAF